MRKLLFVLALLSIISMSFKTSSISKSSPTSTILNGKNLTGDADFREFINNSLDFANRIVSSNSISSFKRMSEGLSTKEEKQNLALKLNFSNTTSLNGFLLNHKEVALKLASRYPELSNSKAEKVIKEALEIMLIEKKIALKDKKPLCDVILFASLGACSTVLSFFLSDGNPYNDDEALLNFANCLNTSYLIYYVCEGGA